MLNKKNKTIFKLALKASCFDLSKLIVKQSCILYLCVITTKMNVHFENDMDVDKMHARKLPILVFLCCP